MVVSIDDRNSVTLLFFEYTSAEVIEGGLISIKDGIVIIIHVGCLNYWCACFPAAAAARVFIVLKFRFQQSCFEIWETCGGRLEIGGREVYAREHKAVNVGLT